MKIKTILSVATMLLLTSCKVQKQEVTAMDYIIIYDTYDGYGETSLSLPTDALILKGNKKKPENNSYENFFNSNNSILGKWEVKEDTLYLYPQYEYRYDSNPKMTEINIDSTKTYDQYIINQKWLIKGDKIYDRSDYSVYEKFDKEWNTGEGFHKMFENPNRYYRLRTKTKLK